MLLDVVLFLYAQKHVIVKKKHKSTTKGKHLKKLNRLKNLIVKPFIQEWGEEKWLVLYGGNHHWKTSLGAWNRSLANGRTNAISATADPCKPSKSSPAWFFYYTPPSRERSSGGYIGITLSVRLSVRLSVKIRVRPITFLWFDIGLSYLAHGYITMRRCVAYIHDPDTTLNFDLKVKFIGFLTCFRVRPITFFGLTLAYHIWHMCLSPRKDVSCTFMIQIGCWPLTSRSIL